MKAGLVKTIQVEMHHSLLQSGERNSSETKEALQQLEIAALSSAASYTVTKSPACFIVSSICILHAAIYMEAKTVNSKPALA